MRALSSSFKSLLCTRTPSAGIKSPMVVSLEFYKVWLNIDFENFFFGEINTNVVNRCYLKWTLFNFLKGSVVSHSSLILPTPTQSDPIQANLTKSNLINLNSIQWNKTTLNQFNLIPLPNHRIWSDIDHRRRCRRREVARLLPSWSHWTCGLLQFCFSSLWIACLFSSH